MTSVRGGWAPAAVALGRLAVGIATTRGWHAAWTDEHGTLTRGELRTLIRRRMATLPEGALIVHDEGQRTVAVESLAGLIARRPVRVVPVSAGERALTAARAATGRGFGFFTSGTTGAPKLVRSARPSPRVAGQMLAMTGLLPVPRRPVVASLARVDHGHGWSAMLQALLTGGHFIAATPPLLGTLPRVDLLTGVPLQLEALRGVPLPPVGVVLSGSDRLPDLEGLEKALGAPVYDAYGASETGTLTLASPSDRRRAPGTVGRPLPGVRISEKDGRLEVRSPMARKPFAGDRGYIRDGLVFVTGRADGARVSGGVVTSANAVRHWLEAQPGVVSAKLSERPDPRFGTRLEATITADRELDTTALREELRRALGSAATPRSIKVAGP